MSTCDDDIRLVLHSCRASRCVFMPNRTNDSPCELGTTVIFVDIWLWFLSDKQQIAVLLYDILLLQQVGEGSVLFFFG